MAEKFKIPHFESESEEAEWWYEHREELAKAFDDAAARGELRHGLAASLARERAASANEAGTIRLDPEDMARARSLASKRGLHYQTYLEMLVHEALAAEEKKL